MVVRCFWNLQGIFWNGISRAIFLEKDEQKKSWSNRTGRRTQVRTMNASVPKNARYAENNTLDGERAQEKLEESNIR